MAASDSEALLIREKDVVYAADDRQASLYEADLRKRLSGAKPAAPEDPNQVLTFRYGGEHPFALRTTLADSFDAIHTIYLLEGSEGVKAFLSENGFAPPVIPQGRAPAIAQQPETFVASDRIPAYRLQKQAQALIRDVDLEWMKRIEPAAAGFGLLRLKQARVEIEREAKRYFPIDNAPAGLKTGFPYPFSSRSTHVQPMLAELRACRTLWKAAAEAQRAYNEAYAKRYAEIRQATFPYQVTPYGKDVDPSEEMLEGIRTEARADSAVRAREDQSAAAKRAVADYVMAAAAEYPVLWRLYKSVEAAAPEDAISREAIGVLQTAYEANLSLTKELEEDTRLVWKFAPLVHQALASPTLALSPYSIPWTAAEERLSEEAGMRLAQSLGLAVGAARLGLAIGARLGAVVIGGPVGVTLVLADAVLLSIDALQEYLAYKTQLSAFNAVLDPSLALASEPSWLSAAFVIATDLAALTFVR